MANFLKSLFIKGVEIDTASASAGNALIYDGTKFAPAVPGTGGIALDDLSDVVITSPEEFQGLSYNGTNWVNGYPPVVTYVRNAEATTLTTGTCVYLFGATGDHASVKRADNNSDTTSSKTIGVVGANITASNNGPIITRGYVDGIDLSTGYTAGDILWLGEAGAFTTTKPTAPDHLVFIGVVIRATNNGIIYVATQNGYELDELHNVSLPSPQSGEFLKYNGSLWVADTIDLGTDTTGNYVGTITAGTGVSTTGASTGEGIAHSISIGQSVATSASPTFAGGVFTGSTSGDLVRITQTGSGNALIVEDATNPDATPFIIDSVGRVGIGKVPNTDLDCWGTGSFGGAVSIIGDTTVQSAANRDRIVLRGRAGGTSNYGIFVTTDTLTNSRQIVLPDTNGTVVTTGDTGTVTGTMIATNTIVLADLATALQEFLVPTGAINMWGTTTAPTGWLICDGTAVSRTTYATLFAVISTTYGVGDNSTTFNLPNLKGKVAVGRDSADASFDTMGELGGAKTHTLTSAESGVPAHAHANTATFTGTAASHNHTQDSHNHTQNAHGHNQNAHNHGGSVGTGEFLYRDGSYSTGFNSWVGNTYLAITWNGGTASATATNIANTATNIATTATNQSTSITPAGTVAMNNTNNTAANASSAHNNLQPYIVLNYIIKI